MSKKATPSVPYCQWLTSLRASKDPVCEYVGYIYHLAAMYGKRDQFIDDYISEGICGYYEALKRFDPDKIANDKDLKAGKRSFIMFYIERYLYEAKARIENVVHKSVPIRKLEKILYAVDRLREENGIEPSSEEIIEKRLLFGSPNTQKTLQKMYTKVFNYFKFLPVEAYEEHMKRARLSMSYTYYDFESLFGENGENWFSEDKIEERTLAFDLLSKLGDIEKEIFLLSVQGYTADEVREILHSKYNKKMSVYMVKYWLETARKKLKS